MQRFLTAGHGIVCYVLGLVATVYAIGFVANVAVPKGVDDGISTGAATSLVIDGLLLGLFAVQHTVMARPAFKRAWTRTVPKPAERSTYVLFTALALGLLFWQWRPLPEIVWDLSPPMLRGLLWGVYACGWGIVLISTFLIDHFELFGLRQAFSSVTDSQDHPGQLKTIGFYRFVRHPLMTGFLIAFWATPTMSVGHLYFAAVSTAYMLIAVQIEERDLLRVFGDEYRDYQKRVGGIIPRLRRSTLR
jgi:protein-S-isoprenylcysteine O-methyltransferase Ste14